MQLASTLDGFLQNLVPDDVPLLGVAALILLYVLVCNLVIDFIRAGPADGFDIGPPLSSSGMSLEELQRLPCFKFRGGGWGMSAGCCAICLDGIECGESCRIFPMCKHVFHRQCIDLWLLKRLSCPTCRSPFNTSCIV